MELVFGKVPTEYHEEGEYFEGQNTPNKFYFKMEVHDEVGANGTISIEDTCGRFLPMDFSELDDLITVLQTVRNFRNDKVDFTNYWKQTFGYPV